MWTFTTRPIPPPSPDEGPGGPILIVSSAARPFSRYYAEILRAEGLNDFLMTDIATLTPSKLAGADVVVLGEVGLSSAQVSMLATWVGTGGKLIAMRPDKKLASLLGLVDASAGLSERYLRVDTSRAPGTGSPAPPCSSTAQPISTRSTARPRSQPCSRTPRPRRAHRP